MPIDKIRLIMADTELCPDDGGTAGSRTTPATIPSVRRSAAQARELLAALAATRAGRRPRCDRQSRTASFTDRRVRQEAHARRAGGGRRLRRRAGRRRRRPTRRSPRVDEWRVLGTSVPKVDRPRGRHRRSSSTPPTSRDRACCTAKCCGRPRYGATLTVDRPGARRKRWTASPSCATATSSAARRRRRTRRARRSTRSRRRPSGTRPQHLSSDELFDHFKETATPEGSGWPQPRAREWGDGAAAFALAKDADRNSTRPRFKIAYIQHAPMEPRAAVAEWTDGKLTVWTGSQQPSRVQGELTQAFRAAAANACA